MGGFGSGARDAEPFMSKSARDVVLRVAFGVILAGLDGVLAVRFVAWVRLSRLADHVTCEPSAFDFSCHWFSPLYGYWVAQWFR